MVVPFFKTFTAVSNISVQYNFQAISIALIVMSQDECTLNADKCKSGIQAAWIHSTATATVFAGCIAGQLTVRPIIFTYGNSDLSGHFLFLVLRTLRWVMLVMFLVEILH